LKRRVFLGTAAAIALAPVFAAAQTAEPKTFYWISHGGPADPVWTYFLQGAEQWATDTGHTVRTSFHSGDVPSQQEAVRAAIAAGADGICSTSPDPGSLVEVVAEARAAGIPVVNFNTPDAAPDWNAYVGGDLMFVGRSWAQYLVDNGHVESGDFVWMPVEVPGASYGVEEEKGIASVFEPLGITWEVTDATLDQAEVITRMTDYITANRDRISAMIGLGDMVTGSVARVWRPGGARAGRDPGRGLGQLARHHAGGHGRLRERGHVAGSAGHELHVPVLRADGDERHPDRLRHHHRGALRGRPPRRSTMGSWAATEP
jgi:simple sugar transport system substrate-binding protein